MPVLKPSADTGFKKRRRDKERLIAKPSNLSAEFVVDSDSDGELKTAKLASKAATPKEANSAQLREKDIVATSRVTTAPKSSVERKPLIEPSKARSIGIESGEVTGGLKQGRSQGNGKHKIYGNSVPAKTSAPNRPDTKISPLLQRRPSPAPLVHRAPRQESSTDSEDNDTEEDSSIDEPSQSKRQKRTNGATPSKLSNQDSGPIIPQTSSSKRARSTSTETSESAESDDSDNDDTSDSESTNSELKKQVKQNSIQQPSKPTKPAALTYKAPPGFAIATVLHSPTSDLATIFSPLNLNSKQLWHITLPASIPVHAIKEVSMAWMLRGETALSYKDTDYNFVPDPKGEQPSKHILLPNEEHNDYRAAPMLISRTLHLRQNLRLPELDNSPRDAMGRPQETSELEMPVHMQPAGLKMRYRPFGDESTQPESPQSEKAAMDTSTRSGEDPKSNAAKFRIPPSVNSVQRKQKRKVDTHVANDDATLESPTKKRHKKRHAEQDAESVDKTRVDEDEQIVAHVKKDLHETLEYSATNRDEEKDPEETPSERERRKSEKRKRRKEREGEVLRKEPTINGAKEKHKLNGLPQDEDISVDPVTRASQDRHNEDETNAKAKRKTEKKRRKDHVDDAENNGTNAVDLEYKGGLSEKGTPREAEKTTRQVDSKEVSTLDPTKSKHDSETSEERAKRKAEKKKRKAEKEKKAQARDSGSLAVAASQ